MEARNKSKIKSKVKPKLRIKSSGDALVDTPRAVTNVTTAKPHLTAKTATPPTPETADDGAVARMTNTMSEVVAEDVPRVLVVKEVAHTTHERIKVTMQHMLKHEATIRPTIPKLRMASGRTTMMVANSKVTQPPDMLQSVHFLSIIISIADSAQL